ncbi:Flp pilus assembly protein CpaB [Anaerovibrio sp.]|uniref:Flp pilus assembly protein CpaB n=1 Tax=Anaerovibrio sp. TaxID=1872532 RepID=UPI003F13E8CB
MMNMLPKLSKSLRELSEKITYRHWVMLAGAASLLLGLLVFVTLNNNEPKQEKTVPVDTVHVVVAKQDIAPKTIIKEGMLEVREMPAHLVPADAVSDVTDVVNRPAKVQIMKDDIVSKRKVLMDISMAGFTGDIPPNCRAVSIGISDVTGVAGFAQPGDFVDVMIISKNGDKMSGRIILQDVLLLAINKATDSQTSVPKEQAQDAAKKDAQQGDGKDAQQSENVSAEKAKTKAMDKLATATLALRPEEALKLVTEAQEGTLYLTLRPYQPKDKFTTDTKYVHYSSVQAPKKADTGVSRPAAGSLNRPAPASAPASGPAYTAPKSGGVEVIRGTAVSREGF